MRNCRKLIKIFRYFDSIIKLFNYKDFEKEQADINDDIHFTMLFELRTIENSLLIKEIYMA